MLPGLWNIKIAKDQGNDKDIVHGEAELDCIAGEKNGRLLAGPPGNPAGSDSKSESHRRTDPDDGPDHGFAQSHRPSSSMKYAEVQSNCHQDKESELRPMPQTGLQRHNRNGSHSKDEGEWSSEG